MGVFLYSFNAIAPMLFTAVLGWFITQRGHMDERSINVLNTVCFRYLLPFHVFNSTLSIDFYADFNFKVMAFCTAGILFLLIASWIIFPRLVKDRKRRCIFIVTSFRSNNIIYALPLAVNLFGDAGVKAAAMLVPVTIILFNFFSVVVMAYYAESGDGSIGLSASLRRTAVDIVKNPLLGGSVLGIVLSLLHVRFPAFLQGGISSVAGIATPLSLILLGAQMDLKKLAGDMRDVLKVCAIRLVLAPAILVPISVLLGFRGPELGALMVIFAAPPAVTNLVMARNYNLDPEFAAQAVILSTVLSTVTMFLAISLLRALALI